MTKKTEKKVTKKVETRGRKRIEVNWVALDGILQYGAKLIDCADILNLSEDTIQRAIKEKTGGTFSEYREAKMSKMRVKLLQKQFESAIAGNTAMMIWLGKQHLGQSEKISTKNEHDFTESPTFEVKFVKKEDKKSSEDKAKT